jgi:hypothetical protein
MGKGLNNKPEHIEEISTRDEVLLNEFFSLIARITIRLTTKADRINNDGDPLSQEVNTR